MLFLADNRVGRGIKFLGSTKFPMVLHCATPVNSRYAIGLKIGEGAVAFSF
jgi:hypothetical protein